MAIAKRKKRFFDVEIPVIRRQTQIYAYELKELEGKRILYDLTRILKGKNLMLSLKIKIEDNIAVAYPLKTTLLPYYIKKMTRKGTDYVEDSFSTNCKDAQVRIKPFLITRRKVSRAVRKALRERVKEELVKYVKTKNSEEIFEEVLKNQLQKTLSLKLKKIYPLSLCEIRTLKVEKEIKQEKEIEQEKEIKKE